MLLLLLLPGRLGRVEGDEEAEDKEEEVRCDSLALSSAGEVGLDRHGGGCSGWLLRLAMRRATSLRDCVSSRQACTCQRCTPSCQLRRENNGAAGMQINVWDEKTQAEVTPTVIPHLPCSAAHSLTLHLTSPFRVWRQPDERGPLGSNHGAASPAPSPAWRSCSARLYRRQLHGGCEGGLMTMTKQIRCTGTLNRYKTHNIRCREGVSLCHMRSQGVVSPDLSLMALMGFLCFLMALDLSWMSGLRVGPKQDQLQVRLPVEASSTQYEPNPPKRAT